MSWYFASLPSASDRCLDASTKSTLHQLLKNEEELSSFQRTRVCPGDCQRRLLDSLITPPFFFRGEAPSGLGDYSDVPFHQLPRTFLGSEPAIAPAEMRSLRFPLPAKLNAILSNHENEHIVSWMPHGQAWRIHDLDRFRDQILPVYFDCGSCAGSINAFLRLLKLWGFRQLAHGPDISAFYNEMFLRGMPNLHRLMRAFDSNIRQSLYTTPEPNLSAFPVLQYNQPASRIDPTSNALHSLKMSRDLHFRSLVLSSMLVSKGALCKKGSSVVSSQKSRASFCSNTKEETSDLDGLDLNTGLLAAQELHLSSMANMNQDRQVDKSQGLASGLVRIGFCGKKDFAGSRLEAPEKLQPTKNGTGSESVVCPISSSSDLMTRKGRKRWLPSLGPKQTFSGPDPGLCEWFCTNPEVFAFLVDSPQS